MVVVARLTGLKQGSGFAVATIFILKQRYFLAFPINQSTSAMIATTIITPTHIPALKIPAMASQLVRVTLSINKLPIKTFDFIQFLFIVINKTYIIKN
jgi:hypothetical protein